MSRYWVSMLSMMLGASISTTIHVWPDAPMWFVALAMCFWLAALFFFTGILHDARAPWNRFLRARSSHKTGSETE